MSDVTEGRRLGPYEILGRLGAGGMAETFRAVRRGPGGFEQHVCLKRILSHHAQNPAFVRMFLQEARIAAKLRHGNIVQVLDFGEVDGTPYMTLELIEGLDLRRLLRGLWGRGENLTSGLAAQIAFELGSALDYAHRADGEGNVRGVIHRDVSPANVLLSSLGEVKLADFGIAKAMYETRTPTDKGLKGKIPYMAPEYAAQGHYDARSDLFSLGVLLYETLTGERPFDGWSDVDTLERISKGDYVPLRTRLPELPRELAATVDRCLARDPAERFMNADAFLDALAAVPPPPTARRILGERVTELRGEPMGDAPAAARRVVVGAKRLSAAQRAQVESADTMGPEAESSPPPSRPAPNGQGSKPSGSASREEVIPRTRVGDELVRGPEEPTRTSISEEPPTTLRPPRAPIPHRSRAPYAAIVLALAVGLGLVVAALWLLRAFFAPDLP